MTPEACSPMRPTYLLLLALLPACASAGSADDPAWREIQRERLAKLYQQQDPYEAVREFVARDPIQVAQEPHLDERLPQRQGAGPRRFRGPREPVEVTVAVGAGDIGYHVKGTQLDDHTDAHFARAAIDVGTGASLIAEAWTTNSELFQGNRINDGVNPAPADARLRGVRLFPNVRIGTVGDGFSMPIRAGVFADWQRIDHQPAGVQREWLSMGPRLALEPSLRLLGDQDSNLELFGRVGGEVGIAWFAEEFDGGDDRDVTARWSGDAGGGLRAKFGAARLECGYELHYTQFGPVETDLYGSHSRSELQRQQVYVGFGVTF